MITSPFEMREYRFFDWDDTVIGTLHLPKVIKDVRAYVNFFVGVNMIHPQLRGGLFDPWADERASKLETALKDFPRNRLYPEEAWYFVQGENGLEIRHSLRYVPAEELRKGWRSFRPTQKGDQSNG